MAPEGFTNSKIAFVKDDSVSLLDTNEQRFSEINKRLDKIVETKNPVMYVFINKGLKMNAGKVAAQVVHAQEELFVEILENADNDLRDFQKKCMKQNPRTVIILEAKDTDELYKINSYLESCDIWTGIYVDEGSADGDYLLEPTAIACQYLDKCDPRTETIFKMFKLYKNRETQKMDRIERILNNYDDHLFLGDSPKETLYKIMDVFEDEAE